MHIVEGSSERDRSVTASGAPLSRRSLGKALLGAAMLPLLGADAALAQVGDDYVRTYVHPDFWELARMIAGASDDPSKMTLETLPQQRATLERYAAPWLSDIPVRQREIPGKGDQPPVKIYIINARPGTARPGILHTHGGGFVAGSAKSSVGSVQAICKALNCAAVTVEYRLAPETRYSGSLEDNYTGLKWLHDHAAEIGVDPKRIAVMGESAGGGHAALLAITARDRGEVPVAFQCLTYPMLDDRTGTTRAVAPHLGRLVWTAEQNGLGWRSFLGQAPGRAEAPAGAVPARVRNLAGLPPAFIGVGALDLFRDEDMDYARRLNDANVGCQLVVVPGAFHGFDGASSPLARMFQRARLEALRRGLGIDAA